MFTLAHLSDPHLGPLPRPRPQELLSKRITGYLNYRRNRGKALTGSVLDNLTADMKAQQPDHIAVTGDLVNIALPAEMQQARRWLESLGTPDEVSLIPGNHDAYVPGALKKACKEWHPFWTSDHADAAAPIHFPYLRRRGPIVLVGLSSGVASAPFLATGKVGRQQLSEAATLLRRCAAPDVFRIVLIHHPPFIEKGRWTKRLTDYKAFNAMIADAGAELILHGHSHRRSINHIVGVKAPIPVIGVPSAASGITGKHEPARYNLFEIEKAHEAWQCTLIERGLTPEGTIRELNRQRL